MSMNRSQRGAARVGIIWLVVFLVLFFVGAVFGYMGYEDSVKYLRQSEEARKAAEDANKRDSESVEAVTRISEVVGWSKADASAAKTEVELMKTGFESFKATFPDMGADIKTIDAALPKAADAYLQRQREIAALKTQVEQLGSEKTTMEQGLRDASRQKDEEISNLRRQLADESNNAAQRQTELESRVAALNTQRNELDAQLRQTRNEMEGTNRKHDDERVGWETRFRSMGESLKFLREPEKADGKVVTVSKDLTLGWIDIGANQRLARGTRFRVVAGSVGGTKLKGWAEVTDVKPSMAEVRIYDVVDRFDPVVAGDVIFNPLYDPTSERTAVLCGRFSGQFNEPELKLLLANMSIIVQPALGNDTDYLIVGSELYTDENGQPLENPLPPSELPVYKNAEALGTNIVSIKQLREYFKF